MNKVLVLLVASVLLLRFSPSAAQTFVEGDSSSDEGAILRTKIDVRSVDIDISDEIGVTALTFAAFKAKYPALGLSCSGSAQGENEAEENDFSGGTIALDLQGALEFITVEFDTTEDEIDEPEEVFLLILENGDGPLMQTDMQTDNEIICSVGRIRDSDRNAITIQLKETNVNLREEATNVTLTIVRNGASEIEREIQVSGGQCGQDFEFARGEDAVIPLTIKLPPTDEAVSELSFLIEILSDDIPELDECFSIQLSSNDIAVEGRTDIVIEDDDTVRVGWNFAQQNSFQVEEGQSIAVCAAILEPQGEISENLFIELDVEPLSSPESGGKFTVEPAFGTQLKFFLHSGARADCVTVTAVDDEKLERSFTFDIKLSEQIDLPRVIIDPDVVMVAITDNDGTPNRPEVTEVKLVNDDKDLFIMWDIEEDELRPIDIYTGTVNATEKANENRRQTVNIVRESIIFESEDNEATIQGIDAEKQYEIQICARNRFGSTCTEPIPFPTILSVRPPEPVLPEESGGLSTGAIIAIVIVLLLLFLCCLLLLLFLFFCCLRERSKNYYPENNEKKHAEEYERYQKRLSRSSSINSELKFELELEQVPV